MTDSVLYEAAPNGLAIITFDRPKALNAANTKMVCDVREALAKVKAADSGVKAVLLMGNGPKGLCSGGDVKVQHGLLKEDPKTDAPKEQMYQEYNGVYEMGTLAVPSVAIVHGITMGFGLGLGCQATYRVATEESKLAMPENNIGLFPDAGFSHLAANVMPTGLGRLMALTGVILKGAGDVIASRLGTDFVPAENLEKLVEGLRAADLSADAAAALKAAIQAAAGGAAVPEPKALADTALPGMFQAVKSVAESHTMLAAEAEKGGWAAELLPALKKGCPFSQAIVFKLLEQAEKDATDSVPEPRRLAVALDRDFNVACRVCYRPDFVEGLRAVLVDKDQKQAWQPSELGGVSEEEVAAALSALPDGERRLGIA